MEIFGFVVGLILLIVGYHLSNRQGEHHSNKCLFAFAFLFYFSQWLCAACGLLWLIKMEIVGIGFNMVTGLILGLIIGSIDFLYFINSEARTPEEQIGGVGLAVFCFVFSLFFGVTLGGVIDHFGLIAQLGSVSPDLLNLAFTTFI